MAPGDHDDLAPGGAHAHQLAHKLLLVWHVLPTLHGPHKVKGGIWEGLCQRIPNLKRRPVTQACFCREHVGSVCLLGRERDALGLGAWELVQDVPAAASDAAPHIHHGLHVLDVRPLQHLLYHVDLCLCVALW
eukprot:CAMPEP_0202348178 /NCGR_PEP_ID=MMETSP1126-20121109/6223_1 /ASSEMBLY_ACC=CAM_ASM_000457 /TAXON_ID=3047 /ORGANISM="Dunaliella tertiolecta, Strain CCMP1320" /LENGTH=132 /DNA_ID=CAMNT_0048939835 /DNA_START=762 /DNA_END=1157 /DNA_ORIENTATION=-